MVLQEVFEKYVCLIKICEYAQERATNKAAGSDFIQRFALPIQGEKVTSKSVVHIKEYFDEKLQQAILDYAILDIVATFEKILFLRIDNASGEIKKIVREKYKTPAPLVKMSESFVKGKEDIYNLSGVTALLEGKIPPRLISQLSAIREHRNWLAHGKRSVGQPSTLTIQEIYNILQEILDNLFEA